MSRASFVTRVVGKYRAAGALCQFARHLTNWRAVWSAYRAGRPVPSPLRLRSGLTLEFTAEDDPIQLLRELFITPGYTPAWYYRPRPGDVLVDIGANIGWFAISQAVRRPGISVHCFEPAARARRLLARNLSLNRLEGAVTVHPEAVAGGAGTAVLHGGASSLHRSFFANAQTTAGAGEEVRTVSLEEALRRTGAKDIALLKVDAEGAEKAIFANASPRALAPVARVALEFHDHFCPGARAAVEEALRGAGFGEFHVGHANGDGTNGILYARRR